MGISRFGSRYEEKLESARVRAEAEEERQRNLTPAELVSQAAANYETLVATGGALSKAMGKALVEVERQKQAITTQETGGGWMESRLTNSNVTRWTSGVRFETEFDIERLGYVFTAHGSVVAGPRKYFVGDEVLNDASKTTVTFQEWIMKVARALYVILRASEIQSPGNHPLKQLTSEALEQLENVGVRLQNNDRIVYKSDLEEMDEAIASIKRSLGATPEQ